MVNIKMYLNKIAKFREVHSNENEYRAGRNGASLEEINQSYLKLKRVLRMQEDIADEIEVCGANSKTKNVRENEGSNHRSGLEKISTQNFIEVDFTQNENPSKKLKDEFDLLGLDVVPNPTALPQVQNSISVDVNLNSGSYLDPGMIVYESKINHSKKEDPEDFFEMIVSRPPMQKPQSESPLFNDNNLFL